MLCHRDNFGSYGEAYSAVNDELTIFVFAIFIIYGKAGFREFE